MMNSFPVDCWISLVVGTERVGYQLIAGYVRTLEWPAELRLPVAGEAFEIGDLALRVIGTNWEVGEGFIAPTIDCGRVQESDLDAVKAAGFILYLK
jgi:hypothetical protein